MPGQFYIEGHKEKLDIKELLTKVAELKAIASGIAEQADKWSGDELEYTTTGLDLNGGVASCGDPGADVFTIPATGRIEVLCAIISMRNASAGAAVTVRAYTNVDGSEDLVYSQAFTQGTDPDGIMVVNGNFGANQPIRFEMHSDNAADTSVDVPYKAIWRELE